MSQEKETLVKCPYCHSTYIPPDADVCIDCAPKFQCDMAMADIGGALNTLVENRDVVKGTGRELLLAELYKSIGEFLAELRK